MSCMCVWPGDCAGYGVVSCYGCGGDQCVCKCGGELDCFGCDECRDWGDEPGEGEDES